MSKKNNNDESENYELKKEYEAYKTLQAWVKTVPDIIKELEEKGETDKLIKYKKQVKNDWKKKKKETKQNKHRHIVKYASVEKAIICLCTYT